MPRLRPANPDLHLHRDPSLMHHLPAWATDRSLPVDVRVAAVAGHQESLITRDQLAGMGLGRGGVERRCAGGILARVHRGVFLVGPPPVSERGRVVAALLACGPGTLVSHASGLYLWDVGPPADGVVHVTRPGRDRLRHPGIAVHVTTQLHAADVRRRHGLPVTAPARTIVDAAHHLGDRDLRWLVEEMLVRRLLTLEELAATVARHPRRRGTARLRRLVDRELATPALTRSEAERRLLDLIRGAGLPEPRVNQRVAGFEVDLHWPVEHVVVEVDGYRFHGSRAAFERDRRRDAELQACGWSVARLTWRRITSEPEATVALLRRVLAAAGPRRPVTDAP